MFETTEIRVLTYSGFQRRQQSSSLGHSTAVNMFEFKDFGSQCPGDPAAWLASGRSHDNGVVAGSEPSIVFADCGPPTMARIAQSEFE